MNYETESKLAGEFFAKCELILGTKAHDYASDKDCFSNFKSISAVCKIPIEKVFLVFMSVKIARLIELIDSNKITMHESIEDSLRDLSNYACLMAVYLQGDEQ
jgi:hypothetical protein